MACPDLSNTYGYKIWVMEIFYNEDSIFKAYVYDYALEEVKAKMGSSFDNPCFKITYRELTPVEILLYTSPNYNQNSTKS